LKSSAATVQQYLEELPEDRRAVVEAVREMVRHNLPEGYRESLNWGMIIYEVPLERYPKTYNGQPLGYVALAAQKNYYALYLNCVYQDPEQEARLREGFKKAGKKLDMGKSCLRFKKLDDLPMNVLAELVAATPPDAFIAQYEASRADK
jgi:hypothetical protein